MYFQQVVTESLFKQSKLDRQAPPDLLAASRQIVIDRPCFLCFTFSLV